MSKKKKQKSETLFLKDLIVKLRFETSILEFDLDKINI